MHVSSIDCPSGFSGSWSGDIPAEGHQNVSIKFNPTLIQDYSGKIIVNSNKTSGDNTINVSGTGIAPNNLPTIKLKNMSVKQTHGSRELKVTIKVDDADKHEITTLDAYFGRVGNDYNSNVRFNVLQYLGKDKIASDTNITFKVNTGLNDFASLFRTSNYYEVKFNCIDEKGGKAEVDQTLYGEDGDNNKTFPFTYYHSIGFEMGKHNWSFRNFSENITKEAYQKAFGAEVPPWYDQNKHSRRFDEYNRIQKKANGYCFGFAVSSYCALENINKMQDAFSGIKFSEGGIYKRKKILKIVSCLFGLNNLHKIRQ